MKVLSLFSGIGAFEKAFTTMELDYELVGFSEIDKWAIEAYSAIHNVNKEMNLGDVSEIENVDLPNADLITYGFPCQDISVAGKGKGINKDTRSGLLYEAERIIEYIKPKYAIAENVKNLIGKRHKEDFEQLLERLESYGYNNYWEVLNAKDYEIPQNRERVFIVSIRKDIDKGSFEFPKGFDSGLRLKDFLLDDVESKYYIENERTENLILELKEELEKPCIVASRGRNPNNPSDRTVGNPTEQRLEPNKQGVTNTLTTVQKDNLVLEPSILRYERTEYGKEIRKQYEKGEVKEKIGNMRELQPREDGMANTLTTVQKDNLVLEPNELKLHKNLSGGKWDKIHESARRVYNEKGVAPTIPTCGGGNIEPKVAVKEATSQGYDIATVGDSINVSFPNSETRRGRVGKGVAQTLETQSTQVTLGTNYKIRKLTPNECWRLMGFTDEDYWVARRALEKEFYNGGDRSNSQMYKMAGNSIVVNVLEGIFKNLLGEGN